MVLYGARVIPVRGSYDDAFRLSLEYTTRKGGLNRNTAYHPLTIEGKKTVGLEIYEQNQFKVPDVILVPVGDGVIISGVFKAYYDLKAAGLIGAFRGHPSLYLQREIPGCQAAQHHRRLDFRLHSLQCAPGTEGSARKPGILTHRHRPGNSARAAAPRGKDRCIRGAGGGCDHGGVEETAGIRTAWPQGANCASHHGPWPEGC
jgi:hypothetical protein